jgi:hypothetical protein
VSREDWACLALIILGLLLFLYGAKYYDNSVGWIGVFLFVAGVLSLIALAVYNALFKRKQVPASASPEAPDVPSSQNP